MAIVPDPDGQDVEAPGGAVWRDDTGRRAQLGGGLMVLSRSGAPNVNGQWQLQDGAGLSTICQPPGGWSKVTMFRLQLLNSSGVPLAGVGESVPHLEVRRILSLASPVIDLNLGDAPFTYSQNDGYTGNLGDLRGYVGPLRFNLLFQTAVPIGLGWSQLCLQIGASTV